MTEPLPRLVLAVCTYQRNGPLAALLDAAIMAAEVAEARCEVGVAVIDDTPEGLARPVVDQYTNRFPLGVEYRVAGGRNISSARNAALEAALALDADWIAMTDDDCVPDARWFAALLEARARSGADAISGPMVRRAPAGAPRWLVEQPFLTQGLATFATGSPMSVASTHNSLVSAAWLRAHPQIRFADHLGRVGGEDMHFFRTAAAAGLRITYAADAVVYEEQPPQRCRFGYQLRNAWWLGNSRTVTYLETGAAGRLRLAAHGLAELAEAAARPLVRLARRQPPHGRFAIARVAEGAGIIAGSIGLRVNHH